MSMYALRYRIYATRTSMVLENTYISIQHYTNSRCFLQLCFTLQVGDHSLIY